MFFKIYGNFWIKMFVKWKIYYRFVLIFIMSLVDCIFNKKVFNFFK